MRFIFFILITIGISFQSSAQRKITSRVEDYNRKGTASFYHNRFEGRKTATGERFRQKKLTAASNTLPLNTYVKVTNLRNGRWTVVRINDRMSKHNRRLIDLTKTAAKELNFIKSGLTKVRVEYIPRKEFIPFLGLSLNNLIGLAKL